MADSVDIIDDTAVDEEIGEGGLAPIEAVEAEEEATGLEDIEPDVAERTTFLEYAGS